MAASEGNLSLFVRQRLQSLILDLEFFHVSRDMFDAKKAAGIVTMKTHWMAVNRRYIKFGKV